MILKDENCEKKLLIQRAFSIADIFKIGKEAGINYFQEFISCWEIDLEEASLEIAQRITERDLLDIFRKHKGRDWVYFRGKNYSLEQGEFNLRGSYEKIRSGIARVKEKYGEDSIYILKRMLRSGGSFGLNEFRDAYNHDIDPFPILGTFGNLEVIVPSYKSEEYREWKMLEETIPLIRAELGSLTPEQTQKTVARAAPKKPDFLEEERRRISEMDTELSEYLNDLLKNRLEKTVDFGREFSASHLAEYLRSLFGDVLFFDGFLSVIQQYSIADVEIMNPHGRTGMKTGWSLALFGEPGTGKSFSTRDLILGGVGGKVNPHGIPGRNRYCGGMTPARFIRTGQAYAGRIFNFIVPEFNDWFRYSGMVDVLKLAMERGEIKYELHREIVGPYIFGSYFSVNYNTKVMGKGYEVTIGDPNFNAIEDRMICRLHRLTKERYVEIAKSQMRLALGEVSMDKGAQQIRDHVTLIYAIETGHPLTRGLFPERPVLITDKTYKLIGEAREAILKRVPEGSLGFSARLENHLIRFVCAASLLSYFSSDSEVLPIDEASLKWGIRLYVEEASVRSKTPFQSDEVLNELSL